MVLKQVVGLHQFLRLVLSGKPIQARLNLILWDTWFNTEQITNYKHIVFDQQTCTNTTGNQFVIKKQCSELWPRSWSHITSCEWESTNREQQLARALSLCLFVRNLVSIPCLKKLCASG